MIWSQKPREWWIHRVYIAVAAVTLACLFVAVFSIGFTIRYALNADEADRRINARVTTAIKENNATWCQFLGPLDTPTSEIPKGLSPQDRQRRIENIKRFRVLLDQIGCHHSAR